MKSSEESAKRNPDLALVLPDWSGMKDHAGRLSTSAALLLNEEYAQLFRRINCSKKARLAAAGSACSDEMSQRLETKIDVEFVL